MGSTMHPPNWGNTMARIPALGHCVLCTTSTTGRREAVVSLRWRDCAFNRRHGNAAFLCEHSFVCFIPSDGLASKCERAPTRAIG